MWWEVAEVVQVVKRRAQLSPTESVPGGVAAPIAWSLTVPGRPPLLELPPPGFVEVDLQT